MSEVWISCAELEETIGKAGASLLCAAVGGASMFIPRAPVKGAYLTALLGEERMGRLCAGFVRIVVPNRRREPYKARIVRMLEAGKSPVAIALELGVTERYVRILARQVKEQPSPQMQFRLL